MALVLYFRVWRSLTAVRCHVPSLIMMPIRLRSLFNRLSHWHHRMVAGSHHRYAKLRNRRSAALERIVMLAFFTPLGSHGAFPLLGACHVAIGDWVLLSALAGDPPSLIRAISSKHRSVLRNRLYRCISVRALCISHCNRALRACARCSCLATMHNILIVLYFRS